MKRVADPARACRWPPARAIRRVRWRPRRCSMRRSGDRCCATPRRSSGRISRRPRSILPRRSITNAVATIAVIDNPDLKALRARAGVADAQAVRRAAAARSELQPRRAAGAVRPRSARSSSPARSGSIINALRTRGCSSQQARAQARAGAARSRLGRMADRRAGAAPGGAHRSACSGSVGARRQIGRDRAQSLLDRTLRAAARGDLAADRCPGRARPPRSTPQTRLRTGAQTWRPRGSNCASCSACRRQRSLRLRPTAICRHRRSIRRACSHSRAPTAPTCRRCAPAMPRRKRRCTRRCSTSFPTLGLTINATRDSAGNKLLGPGGRFHPAAVEPQSRRHRDRAGDARRAQGRI